MVKVSVEIPDQMIADVVITAFDGGETNWVSEVRVAKAEVARNYAISQSGGDFGKALVDGSVLTFYCTDPDTWKNFTRRVTFKKVAEALVKRSMVTGASLFDSGEWDATESDVVLQIAALGEITYG